MVIKFDYEYVDQGFFGQVFRPVALVSFRSPKSALWTNIWMIVDTGADFTILPKYVSKDLKISLENDCIVDTTKGVGGEQAIYLCKNKITAKIGNVSRIVPLGFFGNDEVPPLLGRLGFLETFDTSFLKSHITVFKE